MVSLLLGIHLIGLQVNVLQAFTNVYKNGNSDMIFNSPQHGTTRMSINDRTDKETLIYSLDGILSIKRNKLQLSTTKWPDLTNSIKPESRHRVNTVYNSICV